MKVSPKPSNLTVIIAIVINAILLLVLLLSLLSCGDNLVPEDADNTPDAPAPTWRNAEETWVRGWCLYAERCFEEDFVRIFGTQDVCNMVNVEQNCAAPARKNPCSDPYPLDRLDDLSRCEEDMLTISCSTTRAPDACYRAFE